MNVDRLSARRKRPPIKIPIPNSVDRAVIATDLTGKVLFWNTAAEQVYGWKWDEAVGRSVMDLLVPKPQQEDADRIMEKLRSGESWTGPFTMRRRDGTEFTATITDQPIRDDQGNLIGIIGISEKVAPMGKDDA